MKVGMRIMFEGKAYYCVDREYSDQQMSDFLVNLEKNRAKTISELVLDPGTDGVEKGIEQISLLLGEEAAKQTGIFILHYQENKG